MISMIALIATKSEVRGQIEEVKCSTGRDGFHFFNLTSAF
jgi:hypothetical protein